jgi:demethylmenaquinone methyltransferase/2-methoxy-6-polyprenyl-1,4-benzoquinol methylase
MYARRAPHYRLARRFERERRRAIEYLALREGDTVLDAGCGIGLSFQLFEDSIGPTGTVIGIEQSQPMLARAEDWVRSSGWQNVTLIGSPVEEAEIPELVDAVLFCYTHDILRTPAAVENVMSAARPGTRVAAAGGKFVRWFPPLNEIVWRAMEGSITTFEGLDAPWSHLFNRVPNLRVRATLFGTLYVAWGTVS